MKKTTPRALGFAPPAPWRCIIRDEQGRIAELDIAAPGHRLSKKAITPTVILLLSLLQEPDNPGCYQRLAARLGEDTASAVLALAADLPAEFWIDIHNPQGQRVGRGYSWAAQDRAKRESGPVRQVNPAAIM